MRPLDFVIVERLRLRHWALVATNVIERFVLVDALLKRLSTQASGAYVNVLLTFRQVQHLVHLNAGANFDGAGPCGRWASDADDHFDSM